MHGDYLVAIAVRKSHQLDRLNVTQTSRVAKLVRDAAVDRAAERARGVEEAMRLLPRVVFLEDGKQV